MSSGGTCLVTGGAGFIGCATTRLLLDRFDRVIAFDNLHPQVHPTPTRPAALAAEVELVVGDVTDTAAWDELLDAATPDVVVHLAAETGTGQSLREATRHGLVNVVGTTRMLDALSARQLTPRIVLSSSRAIYGEGPWQDAAGRDAVPGQRSARALAAHEWDFPGLTPLPMVAASSRPSPVSIYGATKLAQENVIEAWSRAFGSTSVTLRLQNVYGPGQSLTNPYTGILALFCRLARSGRSIPVFEDGTMYRDFVYVEDVARALVEATDSGVPAGTVDVGSGVRHMVLEVAGMIAAAYGAPAPTITGEFRPGDVRHAWTEIDAAVQLLGWTPEVQLDQGVRHLTHWVDMLEA